MTTIPFEARRFQSTAAYYLRYRVPYPDALISRVAERSGLKAGDHVLDLGCGPGQLGIAFARLAAAQVTAMDPEPEMLAAAAEGAKEAGVDIAIRQGSSYDIGPDIGKLHLTVMGRSFHWMDRSATLDALDKLIEPGGAVVLFHDKGVLANPNWHGIVEKLAETYAPERRANHLLRKSKDWLPHEAILLRSRFCNLERIGIIVERQLDIEDIIGRVYSMSGTSPQALGDKAGEFERILRSELQAVSPDGKVTEIVESRGLLAFRD
ncbi:class I SAM-dependent methyltransferase [Neorhizobium sp. P12A]|jgi:2-polyprenyl-3-methyl-5-hydroxy-6-metoxy-1,4-benzoquinol methylase|uniref:class I SAM-dependent methyltransferase n=1 Tax=Rhizobium/Agrobacterium group TaxID=227290 RepID=UPI0010439D19|nr:MULTISPECIES: class I SAM-dependent methyltransferase [Rhizobium/Agrobacterium group]KAA0698518.1 class I SAM-dependent methyltransferase [Neorhizobium sp. P12A]TCR89813.1 2-polyprenyl-3-methyl-5-hydroxy-6-metoxy-1,4-benzoquinol methylase [Rhizobium sp. BK376]